MFRSRENLRLRELYQTFPRPATAASEARVAPSIDRRVIQ
jgi:hypothetical protein